MLTDAVADFVLSAWLVAVDHIVLAVRGAVYTPDCVMVPLPRVTAQVTDLFVCPVTVAVNCTWPA